MRLKLTAIALLAASTASLAFAQTTTPPAMAPAPTMAAPAKPAKTVHKRQTLPQRFAIANAAHDGHLTATEAQAAKWTYVAKHFDAIDKDHKGYVTVDDIHAYAHLMHANRHVTPKPAVAAAAPATTN